MGGASIEIYYVHSYLPYTPRKESVVCHNRTQIQVSPFRAVFIGIHSF